MEAPLYSHWKALEHVGIAFCVTSCDTNSVIQLFEEDQGKRAKYSGCSKI